ncbi:hypothetical protein MLD38_026688 [Melastoma candidum]|uniref:Uncharacterized protein n=1 Tax=Melastoma candidum TaxID=119954 RepID=A0ACB9P191_9MYRT|nr:hypothetical protein MLD38_026688 [Melastoma candidum]
MKFMKLGSKPDGFQSDGDNLRYVCSELASDVTVKVGNVKFHLHKFPLLSKSARLQRLVADEIDLSDIPGGASSFEVCARFCYGMTVTLNPYNVVAARCAAEYLEMHESVEKGNLVYKIKVFLASSIFRSWKDSIIVLQTATALLPYSEELKLVGKSIESIATKACADTSRVNWSYTYNRRKLQDEIENDYDVNSIGLGTRPIPKDWWVEDLCELDMELYKRVLANIKLKGKLPSEIIGESLKSYAYRKLPEFSKRTEDTVDVVKYRSTVETIISLLPEEKHSVSCGFMLKLLKSAISVDLGEKVKINLVKKVGQQLEEASLNDLLIRAPKEDVMIYDVDTVVDIVREFLSCESCNKIESPEIMSEASRLMVAKLIDSYLSEIAKDPCLPLSKFVELAEMMLVVPRPSHDGLYQAIDTYIKEHSSIGKSERKRICNLLDCKKLSPDACMHAVQNERLPLRMVVQVFFEQARATASSGSSTPDLPKGIRDIRSLSRGSSRSATTTNNNDTWDAITASEELRYLKAELASLRLSNAPGVKRKGADGSATNKVKGVLRPGKILVKMLLGKGRGEKNGSSDSSESLRSGNTGEYGERVLSRDRRNSV